MKALHFVNVSAVYTEGKPTHFIISYTDNEATKMILADAAQRAYSGLEKIGVSDKGCIIVRRRR